MASPYPTSKDNLSATNPSALTPMTQHAELFHSAERSAIDAIETALGTTGSPGPLLGAYVPATIIPKATGTAATDTAAINTGIATSKGNGSRCIMVGGNYVVNATLSTIDLNLMASFEGPGSAVCTISPTSAVTGDTLRVTPAAWSTTLQAGRLVGFTVDGTNAAAGASGIHYGDLIGGDWDDVVVQHFNGAGSLGVHMDNVTHWTERTRFGRVWISDCTTCLLFDVNGGTNSFGYTHMQDLSLNVNQGQTGIKLQAGCSVYNGIVSTRGNVNGPVGSSGNWIWITGNSSILHSQCMISGEQTSGTGVVALKIDAGSSFIATGYIELPTFTSDSIAGTFVFGGSLNTPSHAIIGGGAAFGIFGAAGAQIGGVGLLPSVNDPAIQGIKSDGTGNIVIAPAAAQSVIIRPGGYETGAKQWFIDTNGVENKSPTTALGNGASTNLTALAKSTGGGPASDVVNAWVPCVVNGVSGWIPFFT